MSERPEDPWLIALGTDVSDGTPVDWSRAEGRATTVEARTIVENLRRLESVIHANRTAASDVDGSTGTASRHWHHLVILERIGSGAFGSVFRAWDTTLEREVALKLVPIDPRRARSPVNEARHLARVPHPNIVRVYGVEQDADQVGIWMEYIQGETLGAMVRDRGPMSAREVVGIGVDLCRALSALQSASLLHRDIKANNVMREVGGRIVLMDFSGAWAGSRGEMPSTMSGTPLYMAPELFEGKPPAIATDIYSLGVLLFFLLSGQTPVAGDSIDDVKSAHTSGARTRLRDLRPELPDAVVQVVERATSPNPDERYQTAGELEHALIGTQGAPSIEAPLERPRVPWRWAPIAALAAAALAVGAFALGRIGAAAPVAQAPLVHLPLGHPENTWSWPRISPNGRMVVYGTVSEGHETLWLHPLESNAGYPLAHTSARESTFWSPDSRHLAFFDNGKLKRLTIGDTNQPQVLADASQPRGGDWGSGGVIIFSDASGLVRINADGTGRAAATTLDLARGEFAHQWPEFLPDGRRFVFVVRSSQPDHAGVYLASLDSTSRRRLMPAYSRAVYAPPGYLLFAKDGALLARPFDPNSMQPRGAATLVAPRVKYHEASDAAFDVSNNGVLVYREPEGLPVTRLFLRDRQGELNSPLTPIGAYRHPRFSPNGHRVVVERFESESSQPDLWLYDRERQMSSPFVTNQGLDIAPAWSSDGQHIAFSSKRGSRYDVYTKTVDETTEEQIVIGQQGDTIVEDWADGRGLLTSVFGKGLLLTPFDRSQPPTMVLPSSLSARWLSEMSDDGKWIAYTSVAGKTTEVFVEPVGGTGSRWQVSADGGVEPHWREDSRELFYLTLDGVVAAVDVSTDGTRLHTGQPKYLFRAKTPEFLTSNFHVTRDGQTFVVNTLIAYPHVPPVRVVVNWTRALDR